MTGWVVRVTRDPFTCWLGPMIGDGLQASATTDAVAVFETPQEARDALAVVGWRACDHGWIVPHRVALIELAPHQLGLAL